MINEIFSMSPKRLLGWIMAICLMVFCAAYVMEHQFGILSCKLCVIERFVFVGAGILAFFTFILFPPKHRLF